MIQMVRYYRIPSGRNAGIVVAFGDWPERVLKHRGWTPERCVYRRVATAAEHAWLAACLRFQAFRYETIEGLLSDEAQVVDQEMLKSISHSLQRTFQ